MVEVQSGVRGGTFSVYICMYIHKEREREREGEPVSLEKRQQKQKKRNLFQRLVFFQTHTYIYCYIQSL